MDNPIYRLKLHKQSFVYFHTLLFNMNTLRLAQRAGTSIEIDVSISDDGELYIGHPAEFYAFKNLESPDENLPIETIVDLAKQADLFLVFDCKDVRALPWIKQMVYYYGANRVMFHSWVDVFKFEPYPSEIQIEPHWKYEDLPFNEVLALKQATGVPVISSVRGLTSRRLVNEPELVDFIIDTAAGQVDAINFNLPHGELPDNAIIQRLLDNNLLTLVNVDHVPEHHMPEVFIGLSDHISATSKPA